MTRFDRFWDKVIQVDACLLWVAACNEKGYGKFLNYRAHRYSYETTVGPIPGDLQLDHLCRNKACINPEHLEPVTAAENMARGPGSITRCRHGHPYDDLNTYRDSGGRRRCRTCNRDRQRRLRAAA